MLVTGDVLYIFVVHQPRSVVVFMISFFFFKQKTAYEMLRSLVGSEMCIRDRAYLALGGVHATKKDFKSAADVYDKAVTAIGTPDLSLIHI